MLYVHRPQLADVLDNDSKLKEMIVVLEEHKTLTSKRMQPFEEQEAARRAVEHKKAIQQRDVSPLVLAHQTRSQSLLHSGSVSFYSSCPLQDLYNRLAPSGHERAQSVASDTLSDISVSSHRD